MADVKIDYETLNQIAGALKNLAVDLAAGTTWEDEIASAVEQVWDDTGAKPVQDAVEDMIGDWSYVRSVLALQAMDSAERADAIGSSWAGWDEGVGVRGETALATGAYDEASDG